VIQIPLEMGLGIWLLSGLFRKAAWLVAVISFGLFMGVTLQKGLTGAESCGCFGRFQDDPWVTFLAVDVSLFLGLLIFRPKGGKLLPPPWPSAKHFFGVAIPTFIFLGGTVAILIFNKPPDKTSRYEVVRPEEWTSKEPAHQGQTTSKSATEEWPMLKYIDIADSLRSNIAVVLFYHTDCPDCQDAIVRYDQAGRKMVANEGAIRIAFIEVPPYGPQQNSLIPSDTPCLKGKLDSSKEWYNITTPLVVLMVDGSVVKSWLDMAPEFDEILDTVFAAG